jgi:hypothetical protein
MSIQELAPDSSGDLIPVIEAEPDDLSPFRGSDARQLDAMAEASDDPRERAEIRIAAAQSESTRQLYTPEELLLRVPEVQELGRIGERINFQIDAKRGRIASALKLPAGQRGDELKQIHLDSADAAGKLAREAFPAIDGVENRFRLVKHLNGENTNYVSLLATKKQCSDAISLCAWMEDSWSRWPHLFAEHGRPFLHMLVANPPVWFRGYEAHFQSVLDRCPVVDPYALRQAMKDHGRMARSIIRSQLNALVSEDGSEKIEYEEL